MSASGLRTALRLDVHGVTLALTSELEAFARYAGVTLEPFAARQPGGGEPVRVESVLEWVEGAPPRDLPSAFGVDRWDRRPDRDLYVDGPNAYWLRIDDFEDLQLAASWREGRLRIRGRYYFRVGRGRGESLRKLVYRTRLDALRARRFSTLVYYLVYHPVLWLLSREQGWHVLHAGAVAATEGAAVFAGMPGCGKSTLAVAMTADRSCTMLSDNLLLTDGARVLACPEPLLLDRRSLERVGTAARRLRSTGDRRVYDRDAYRPDATEMRPVAPAAIFRVERARTTSCGRIDAAACASALAAGNGMAKEVRRIAVMAHVLDVLAGTSEPDAAAARARLAASAPAYALGVGEGADLGAVLHDHVMPALPSGSPAAAASSGRRDAPGSRIASARRPA